MSHLPLVIVEGVMVFGGALLFGWWQLRSVRRDREKAAEAARRRVAGEGPIGDAAESPAEARVPAEPAPARGPSDPTA